MACRLAHAKLESAAVLAEHGVAAGTIGGLALAAAHDVTPAVGPKFAKRRRLTAVYRSQGGPADVGPGGMAAVPELC